MRIGVLQRSDVSNIRSLSGYPYFMARALREHVGEVIYLSPDYMGSTKAIEIAGKCLNRLTYNLFRRRISPDHHRILSRHLARAFSHSIVESHCDVIFAPAASAEVACLTTTAPIVYLTDLNFANIVDYYPSCLSLFGFACREADFIEGSALKTASAVLYPSKWAANTAVEHYGVDPAKVYCVPWGANFDVADIPTRELALGHSLESGLNLLWVGVDWERKGGPIAYDCLMELLGHGMDVRLVVCGCVPPRQYLHPKVKTVPFLDKNDSDQRQRLSSLFLSASFFLFPTMAEAYGIVLCEASAHGLPSLVRNTGGVGGAIMDGENGYLMPPNAKGAQYAAKIIELTRDPAVYHGLVKSSRMAYEQRLNWDAWGRSVKPIFMQVAGNRVH